MGGSSFSSSGKQSASGASTTIYSAPENSCPYDPRALMHATSPHFFGNREPRGRWQLFPDGFPRCRRKERGISIGKTPGSYCQRILRHGGTTFSPKATWRPRTKAANHT